MSTTSDLWQAYIIALVSPFLLVEVLLAEVKYDCI